MTSPSPAKRPRRGHLIGRLLRRGWIPLLAVVVVVLAAFGVVRLNGVFGSRDVTSTPGGGADEIVPFNPKRVVLEVFGAPGTVATITYLDLDAQPQRVDDVALPWTYDETTTLATVFVNLQAQGDSDSIGCRITIDGAVKDERIVDQTDAYTYCLDKSG